jgi:hypothetical protein
LTDSTGAFVLDSHGEQIVTAQQNVLPSISTSTEITQLVIAIALVGAGIALVLLIESIATRSDTVKPEASTVEATD